MIFGCGSQLTGELLHILATGRQIASQCEALAPGCNLADTFCAESISAGTLFSLRPQQRNPLQWRYAQPSTPDFLKAAYSEADIVYMGMMAAQEFFPYGKKAPKDALEVLAEKRTGDLADLAYSFLQNRILFSNLLKAENAQFFLAHLETAFSLYLSEVGRLAFEGQKNRMSALGMVGDLEYIARAAMLVFDDLYTDESPLKAKVRKQLNVRVELFQTLFRRRYFETPHPGEVYPLWRLPLPAVITNAKTFLVDALFEEAFAFSLRGHKTKMSIPDHWSFLCAPKQTEYLRKALLELYVLLVDLVKTKADCFSSALDAIRIETTEDNMISITVENISGEGIAAFEADEVSEQLRKADWSMSILKETATGTLRVLLLPSLRQLHFQNPLYHVSETRVLQKKPTEADKMRDALASLGIKRDLSRG